MLSTLLKKITRQFLTLLLVVLVLLAAYVSAGRQFMPAISGYAEYLENRILLSTGIPVKVDKLSGSFRGFNPLIGLESLHLALDDLPAAGAAGPNPLLLERITLELDMARSLWQRRWVLEKFLIEDLHLALQQNAEGSWQLSGLDGFNSEVVLNLEVLYEALLGLSQLDLTNMVVSIQDQAGKQLELSNGLVSIRNQGDLHFVHIDASLRDSTELLSLSMEVRGNQFSEMAGRLYLNVPQADYSLLSALLEPNPLHLLTLQGKGELWLDLVDGQVTAASSLLSFDELVLAAEPGNPLHLRDLAGQAVVSRNLPEDRWEVELSDWSMTYGEQSWQDWNSFLRWSGLHQLTVRASHINIPLLADLAAASGLLDETMQEQLAALDPAGRLLNLDLTMSLDDRSPAPLLARANLAEVRIGSYRGSPRLGGVSGYLELEYDQQSRHLSGLLEVESENFSINLPNTFTRSWDYDYLNGRLHFDLELDNGERMQLLSSVIVAESEAVDGRVQFSSRLHRRPDGSRESSLELMAGASRADAKGKSLYLLDGPNVRPRLRRTMEYLDRAIIAGDLRDSAVLFRGNTTRGSDPVTRTFQSFFQLDGGEVEFSPDWPPVQQLAGQVSTDNNKVDMAVQGGSSLGLQLERATGRIRRNTAGQSWLSISGLISAETASGLEYLQQAPVNADLRNSLSGWKATGGFTADSEITVPLARQTGETDFRIEFLFADNELDIPAFDLSLTDLAGPVIFDTRTGFEQGRLQAQLFGDELVLSLSSEYSDRRLDAFLISAVGRTTPSTLSAWPGQGDVTRNLLAQTDGTLGYLARLRVVPESEQPNYSLRLQSQLQEVELRFPPPLRKSADAELALDLKLEFAGDQLAVDGSLGSELRLNLQLDDGELQHGLLALGLDERKTRRLGSDVSSGLTIGAELDTFDLEQWTDFIDQLGSPADSAGPGGGESGAIDFADSIAAIELAVDRFFLYGQELSQVNVRLQPDFEQAGWSAVIGSEMIAGDLLIPFDSREYLRFDLDYLHLPAGDGSGTIADADRVAALTDEAIVQLAGTGQGGISPQQASTEPAALPAWADLAGADTEDRAIAGGGPRNDAGLPATQAEDPVPVDPLVNLDPRDLPLMKFSTDEFSIGPDHFGSWQFRLVPTADGAEFYDLNFDFRGLRLGRDEADERIENLQPHFSWSLEEDSMVSELRGVLVADDIGAVLEANGYAPSLESDAAYFVTKLSWPGSPAFFAAEGLNGQIDLLVEDGRFLRNSEGGQGALRLVSLINLTAVFQRLRFSDDLLRRGLAFDEIVGSLLLDAGRLQINDQLVISGPSSQYQISGAVDLATETVEGEMYVTLPLSINLPWVGLLTANFPLAIGAYIFGRFFGDQVDSLSTAVYTLNGPLEGLEPEFKQAFGSPESGVE